MLHDPINSMYYQIWESGPFNTGGELCPRHYWKLKGKHSLKKIIFEIQSFEADYQKCCQNVSTIAKDHSC